MCIRDSVHFLSSARGETRADLGDAATGDREVQFAAVRTNAVEQCAVANDEIVVGAARQHAWDAGDREQRGPARGEEGSTIARGHEARTSRKGARVRRGFAV